MSQFEEFADDETCPTWVDYNPILKYADQFPPGFFNPTTETLTSVYEHIVRHVEILFEKIKDLTNVQNEENSVLRQLKTRNHQLYVFNEIKSSIQYSLDQLTKLHTYVDNIDISDYVELFGNFLKTLMETWDNFFNKIFRLRFKKFQKSAEKQLKRYLKRASRKTQAMHNKIDKLKDRLKGMFKLCSARSEKQIIGSFYDSMRLFTFSTLKFDVKCSEDSDSETENPVPEVPPRRIIRRARRRINRNADLMTSDGLSETSNRIMDTKYSAVYQTGDVSTVDTATKEERGVLKLRLKRDGGSWIATPQMQSCGAAAKRSFENDSEDVVDKKSIKRTRRG